MRFLINASNLKVGGGVQVADSICRELVYYPQHHFLIVHSSALNDCVRIVQNYENIKTLQYETPLNLRIVITGRDKMLDSLVIENDIDAVLTIFGPSRWRPKIPHLSGFAKPQLVLPESPFWEQLTLKKRIEYLVKNWMTKVSFDRCSNYYFTENPFISKRLKLLFPKKKIFTVSNNANQIFQQPNKWDLGTILPVFDGITLLTVSANYPHKNLPIILTTCHILEDNYPQLNFRFVLTINENDLSQVDECSKRHIIFLGPIKIEQVPSLYEQCDIMFLPTLLECFSASYAEAMIMNKPIITTDLNFAHGLCGKAAEYYSPVDPQACADAIYKVATNQELRERLVENGKKQLKSFDTYSERAEKLIRLLENNIK